MPWGAHLCPTRAESRASFMEQALPHNHRSLYRNPRNDMLTPCTAEDMEALKRSWDLLTVKVKGPGMD